MEDKRQEVNKEVNNSDVKVKNITDSSISKQKHVVEMPDNGKRIDIEKDCYFGPKNKFSAFWVKLLYKIAIGILYVCCKAFMGLKVVGRENFKAVSKNEKGLISVSNHMHVMDTPLVAVSLRPYFMQFTSMESNFAIQIGRAHV